MHMNKAWREKKIRDNEAFYLAVTTLILTVGTLHNQISSPEFVNNDCPCIALDNEVT